MHGSLSTRALQVGTVVVQLQVKEMQVKDIELQGKLTLVRWVRQDCDSAWAEREIHISCVPSMILMLCICFLMQLLWELRRSIHEFIE